MTNHWIDLQHCKTILVEGSNVAENHPMAFKWIRKAQENGAKIIHVDPRFTRTSAAADMYARIRPGTDAALLNTIINYVLVHKLYDEDYITTHTNALFLGHAAFDFKDGLFSGFDAEKHKYGTETWGYQLDAKGKPRVAANLADPHCVFTRLKTFVSRYTLEVGERITGIPATQIQQIAETMAKNRPGAILYALGMTQHTTGVQGIRAFTILQLLLGNVGKPGSGVDALRGEPNVQGACDMGVLNNYMPGYLNYPAHAEPTLAEYTKRNGTADSKFLVNTLKAFYGDAATPENDFAYAWLPKRSAAKDYGTMSIFESALAGTMKMLWIVGQNPAVTMPNLNLTFEAMAKLETLVVQEIWETETATFWRRPGVDPKSISTEVILLPASFFMEKNGTISNSGGLVQWRHAAVKPPGEAKPDGEIVDLVFRRVRDVIKDSADPKDEIIRSGRQPEGRRSGQESSRLAARRLDLFRGLDLRWGFRRRGKPLQTPGLADGSRRSRPLSQLRMDLAEQHAHSLQPSVVRSTRQTISGLGAHHLVGRDSKALGGIRRAGRPCPDRRTEYAERPASIPLESGGCGTPLRGGLPGPGPEEPPCSPRCGLRAERWPTAGNVRAR